MKLFKLYVVIGFILVIIGIIFDFGFVRTPDKFVETVENSHNAWQNYVYNLMRFYLIILGLLNITFGLFLRHLEKTAKLRWIVFYVLNGGGIILFLGLILAAQFRPGAFEGFTGSVPYYLEVIGILAIIASIIIEVSQIIRKEAIE